MALSATRSAVEEGVVPGGGLTLIRVREALTSLKLKDSDEQNRCQYRLSCYERAS